MDDLNEEQREREVALYTAMRVCMGDERWSSYDIIGFSEYILRGEKVLPTLRGE